MIPRSTLLLLLIALPALSQTFSIVSYDTFSGDGIMNRPNQARFLVGPLEEFCKEVPTINFVDDKLGDPLASAVNSLDDPEGLVLVNTHGVAPNYPLMGYFMHTGKQLAKMVPDKDAPNDATVPGNAVVNPIVRKGRRAFLVTCHAGACNYRAANGCIGAECGPTQTASQTAPGWRKLAALYCESIGQGNGKLWEKFDVNHDGVT